MTFLEFLVQKGLINENQMSQAVRIADDKYEGNLDKAFIELKLDENAILSLKGAFFNIPVREVDPKTITPSILKYIPYESAKMYSFVPIAVEEGVLQVGITNPDNISATDALQFITGKDALPFKINLISYSVFSKLLDMYGGIGGEVDQALSELDSAISNTTDIDKEVVASKEESKDKKGEEKIVEDAPIIKIVAVILRHATEGLASDIHIENTGENVKVRFRVDGILHTSLILPSAVYSGVVARIKILAKLRLDEKRKPQDGGFSAKIDGRKIEFRVSSMPAYFGEKIVMRILDSERGIKSIDDLDMSPENLALVKTALAKPYGLILLTGPTGSGKSTSIYSLLNELDKEERNIVSLEDPVEYQISGINQSQVMPEIGYTFASGLRSILRQDPDVIMVGEIRDKETAELAIQAALTGHLVFSTLHTNSAVGAIPRLIDMGIDPYLIAPTLVLTIAQRLVKRICPTSKKEIARDGAIDKMIEKQFADLPDKFKASLPLGNTPHEAVPSPECPAGTRGRIAVFEMFAIDKEMQEIILKNPVESAIYNLARERGMVTMREDALIKSLKGDVPLQDVYTL
jgi:type IV pilus assembly protein PilB